MALTSIPGQRPRATGVAIFVLLSIVLAYGHEFGDLGLFVAIVTLGMGLVFLSYVRRFVIAVEALASES